MDACGLGIGISIADEPAIVEAVSVWMRALDGGSSSVLLTGTDGVAAGTGVGVAVAIASDRAFSGACASTAWAVWVAAACGVRAWSTGTAAVAPIAGLPRLNTRAIVARIPKGNK